jgi:hypothetical protein
MSTFQESVAHQVARYVNGAYRPHSFTLELRVLIASRVNDRHESTLDPFYSTLQHTVHLRGAPPRLLKRARVGDGESREFAVVDFGTNYPDVSSRTMSVELLPHLYNQRGLAVTSTNGGGGDAADSDADADADADAEPPACTWREVLGDDARRRSGLRRFVLSIHSRVDPDLDLMHQLYVRIRLTHTDVPQGIVVRL